MKVIKPDFIIEDIIDGKEILRKLEKSGRTAIKVKNKLQKIPQKNL